MEIRTLERRWLTKSHKNQKGSLVITMREMQLNPKAKEIERR
jgi:hypothetical protein